ncbi:hypothetical protein ABZ507_11670 [Nocardia niwae]|uniref:Transposase DDE domain-containing protein n=1 Tax=Nocardia niwae TaxID=626084 RepID=A0ABV2X986_9NOCA
MHGAEVWVPELGGRFDPRNVTHAMMISMLGGLSESERQHVQQRTRSLRAVLGLVKQVIRMLARSSDFWLDDCWIVDSTPVPCGMSRPTVARSELAGWAGYGYCASHTRFYWGLKLYLMCRPVGMPIPAGAGRPELRDTAGRVRDHHAAPGAPVTRSLIAYDP